MRLPTVQKSTRCFEIFISIVDLLGMSSASDKDIIGVAQRSCLASGDSYSEGQKVSGVEEAVPKSKRTFWGAEACKVALSYFVTAETVEITEKSAKPRIPLPPMAIFKLK